MIDTKDTSSTRPYLIRALYEWCTDNGLTPYISVAVNEHVLVPHEFVKDGEIVLNISFDATTALKLGNEFLEFKARFGGVAREIIVPIEQIIGIYARENGQGMAFPNSALKATKPSSLRAASKVEGAVTQANESRATALVSVDSSKRSADVSEDDVEPRPPANGARPTLTRIK
jgi:stringent starvation protein B